MGTCYDHMTSCEHDYDMVVIWRIKCQCSAYFEYLSPYKFPCM